MLRVSLLGNMGADPEVRYSPKGTQITSFRVAVNQVRTGPDGERQENTEWFRIRVANRQSEFVQRLVKGTRVLVIGRLDIGHYQSRDGEPRTSFDVWADEVQALSARTTGMESENLVDGEGDAQKAAVAGVSSVAGASGARANSNDKGARPSSRPEPVGGESSDGGLEDLPF
jgi:single-strand DNA-binding protein